MKKSFQDFMHSNPNYRKFEHNADAVQIFDFLSEDESIIKMIDVSEQGKPALAAVVKQLEMLLADIPAPTISFVDNFTKQMVGTMIKCILEPFGYRVKGQKALPKDSGAKQFVSASCYQLNPEVPISLKVVKKIEEV